VTIWFFVFDLSGNAVAMVKNNEAFQVVDCNHLSGSGEAFVCDLDGENCVKIASPIRVTGKRVVPEGVAEQCVYGDRNCDELERPVTACGGLALTPRGFVTHVACQLRLAG
jgi:hypothetical protein